MRSKPTWRTRVAALSTTSALAVGGALVASGPAQADVAEAPAPGDVVVDESFGTESLPAGFTPVSGDWRVEHGRLVGTGGAYAGDPARLVFGEHLERFELSATMRFESVENGSRWAGLILDIDPGGERPWQHAVARTTTTAGNGIEFAQRTASDSWNVTDSAAAPTDAGTGTDVAVTIRVDGTHGEWFFDGAKVLETDALLRSDDGVLGVVLDGATVSFDDIELTDYTGRDFPSDDVVLREAFDGDAVPAGWSVLSGGWEVADGRLRSTTNAGALRFGQHLDAFTLEATVRFVSVTNSSRWLAFVLDGPADGSRPWQQAALRTTSTAGNGLEFATANADGGWGYLGGTHAAPSNIGTGKDARIKLVVDGTHGEWWYDGVKVFETDALMRTADGVQGLSHDGSIIEVDDLRLTVPAAGTGDVVLAQDFTGVDLPTTLPDGWSTVEGTWQVGEGVLKGTADGNGRLTFGPHLDDYRFEARMRFDSVANGARWAGLILDTPADGGPTWQHAIARTGSTAQNGIEFAQSVDSSWVVTDTGSAPTAAGTGRWVDVRIEVHGVHGQWFYDDVLVAESFSLARTDSGVLGLIVNGSTVSFDDVRVTVLEPEPEPEPVCYPEGLTTPGETGVIVAHRGDSAHHPENTMSAFRSAHEKGAEYFELDFDWSSDGVIFAMHDNTLDRTTNGTGANQSRTWEYISGLQIDGGANWQSANEHVPSSTEIMRWMAESGMKSVFELKGSWPLERLQQLEDEIYAHGIEDQVIVQDFDAASMTRWKSINDEIPAMWLTGGIPADPGAWAAANGGIDGINPSSIPSPTAMAALHTAGLQTFVWTKNTAGEWATLTQRGVDGIITDRPGELRAWYDDYRAANPDAGHENEIACDKTPPTVTVKDGSTGGDGVWSEVSFTLFDAVGVDKAVLNGVEKDLAGDTRSDLDGIRPGVSGAVEGVNTLVVHDLAGNTTTYEFALVLPELEAAVPRIVSDDTHGRIKPGAWLHVETGTWSPEPDVVAYQWFADGEPVEGATGTSFHLTGDWKEHDITVQVTGTKAGYQDATVTSEPVRVDKDWATQS